MSRMIEDHVAIPGCCAWPNLTLLPDGTIIAAIFNQPTHGRWEGQADCWASEDGGVSWTFRGAPAPHKPTENRMNVGGGLAGNGDLIVLCSGWNHRPPRGVAGARSFQECTVLPALVSRSGDGGRTWDIQEGLIPKAHDSEQFLVPFGDFTVGDDGALCQGFYTKWNVYVMRSYDDGRSWKDLTVVAAGNVAECHIMHVGGGKWIGVTRMRERGGFSNVQFRSDDDGRTWRHDQPLTLPRTSAAHVMRLRDGRLLFSFGDRCWNRCGIDIRISDDGGETWGPPYRLKHLPSEDSGYPSTVERADGTLVTAYYTATDDACTGYHMGVLRWRVDDLKKKST